MPALSSTSPPLPLPFAPAIVVSILSLYFLLNELILHLLPPVSEHVAVIVLEVVFEFLFIHVLLPPDTLQVGGSLSILTVWLALQLTLLPALSSTSPPLPLPFAPAVLVSILSLYFVLNDLVLQPLPLPSSHVAVIVLEVVFDALFIHVLLPPVTLHTGFSLSILTLNFSSVVLLFPYLALNTNSCFLTSWSTAVTFVSAFLLELPSGSITAIFLPHPSVAVALT